MSPEAERPDPRAMQETQESSTAAVHQQLRDIQLFKDSIVLGSDPVAELVAFQKSGMLERTFPEIAHMWSPE